jgi:GT2 family glycosyltransferase
MNPTLNTDKHISDMGMFIMTRNRPDVLFKTIKCIKQQTRIPAEILIIDNSDNDDTLNIFNQLHDSGLSYFKVGYNAGPAGAAYLGMDMLFKRGYSWVLWGDDDDPPQFEDVIESLYNTGQCLISESFGLIGVVGGRFSFSKAKMIRIPDSELNGLMEVDTIAGNMFPLIYRNVYENKIFPDPSLFFGFEELDFCLSVKRSGLKIYVSGDEMFRHREKFNRLEYKPKLYHAKAMNALWREYYGVRNLLNLLLKKDPTYLGSFLIILRSFIKSFYGFRYGVKYGVANIYYLTKGIKDGVSGRLGLTVLPMKK